MRKDLKMSEGKRMVQFGHASQAATLELLSKLSADLLFDSHFGAWSNIFEKWKTNGFTKICLEVDNQAELYLLRDRHEKHYLSGVIVDEGRTEFNNFTPTCAYALVDKSSKDFQNYKLWKGDKK